MFINPKGIFFWSLSATAQPIGMKNHAFKATMATILVQNVSKEGFLEAS